MKTFPQEEELIILSTRLELSESQRIDLGRLALGKGLSWQRVLKKADWYRTSAFLLFHLRHLERQNEIPSWVMDELKRTYFRNGYVNLQRWSGLHTILLDLQKEGIPVIALKGAALLETVYPNRCLRPMSDIDLLVPEDQSDAAQSIVMQFGYVPLGSPEQQESQRLMHHHLPRLVTPDGFGVIEVHSHIVPRDSPFRFDITQFWNRAISCRVAGVDALILAPEHQLMHLAVHFFLARRFGSSRGLSQICDIAETIRHYQNQIDWSFMEKEVWDLNLQGPTSCGLFLAQSLLDAPVPEGFLDRIMSKETSASGLDLLLRRRVLTDSRAVASEWVRPEAAHNLPNLVSGLFHRVLTVRTGGDSSDQGNQVSLGFIKKHLLRVMDGVTLLGRYWRNPLELRRELQVDRWIHSITAEALVGTHHMNLNSSDDESEQEDHKEVSVP